MKFIQSVNNKNALVNLEMVHSIKKYDDYIILQVINDHATWNGTEEELNKDWKTIIDALNADVSSLHTIK